MPMDVARGVSSISMEDAQRSIHGTALDQTNDINLAIDEK